MANQNDGKQKGSGVIDTILFMAVVFTLSLLIVVFIGQRTTVSGSSMEHTLHDGDNLIIDKISYRFRDPERFDIIVFPTMGHNGEEEEKVLYIKRIIGLPGETVRIDDYGVIYINGVVLPEDYGFETILNPGMAVSEIALAEDEYFVLGDNRNNSTDSRMIGPIHRKDLVGRAFFRLFPFNKMELIKHG